MEKHIGARVSSPWFNYPRIINARNFVVIKIHCGIYRLDRLKGIEIPPELASEASLLRRTENIHMFMNFLFHEFSHDLPFIRDILIHGSLMVFTGMNIFFYSELLRVLIILFLMTKNA